VIGLLNGVLLALTVKETERVLNEGRQWREGEQRGVEGGRSSSTGKEWKRSAEFYSRHFYIALKPPRLSEWFERGGRKKFVVSRS